MAPAKKKTRTIASRNTGESYKRSNPPHRSSVARRVAAQSAPADLPTPSKKTTIVLKKTATPRKAPSRARLSAIITKDPEEATTSISADEINEDEADDTGEGTAMRSTESATQSNTEDNRGDDIEIDEDLSTLPPQIEESIELHTTSSITFIGVTGITAKVLKPPAPRIALKKLKGYDLAFELERLVDGIYTGIESYVLSYLELHNQAFRSEVRSVVVTAGRRKARNNPSFSGTGIPGAFEPIGCIRPIDILDSLKTESPPYALNLQWFITLKQLPSLNTPMGLQQETPSRSTQAVPSMPTPTADPQHQGSIASQLLGSAASTTAAPRPFAPVTPTTNAAATPATGQGMQNDMVNTMLRELYDQSSEFHMFSLLAKHWVCQLREKCPNYRNTGAPAQTWCFVCDEGQHHHLTDKNMMDWTKAIRLGNATLKNPPTKMTRKWFKKSSKPHYEGDPALMSRPSKKQRGRADGHVLSANFGNFIPHLPRQAQGLLPYAADRPHPGISSPSSALGPVAAQPALLPLAPYSSRPVSSRMRTFDLPCRSSSPVLPTDRDESDLFRDFFRQFARDYCRGRMGDVRPVMAVLQDEGINLRQLRLLSDEWFAAKGIASSIYRPLRHSVKPFLEDEVELAAAFGTADVITGYEESHTRR